MALALHAVVYPCSISKCLRESVNTETYRIVNNSQIIVVYRGLFLLPVLRADCDYCIRITYTYSITTGICKSDNHDMGWLIYAISNFALYGILHNHSYFALCGIPHSVQIHKHAQSTGLPGYRLFSYNRCISKFTNVRQWTQIYVCKLGQCLMKSYYCHSLNGHAHEVIVRNFFDAFIRSVGVY